MRRAVQARQRHAAGTIIRAITLVFISTLVWGPAQAAPAKSLSQALTEAAGGTEKAGGSKEEVRSQKSEVRREEKSRVAGHESLVEDKNPQSAIRNPQSVDPNAPAVNLVPSGEFRSEVLPDGSDVLIISDGIYVWQQRPAEKMFLEFRARNAVVFYNQKQMIEAGRPAREPNQVAGEEVSSQKSEDRSEGESGVAGHESRVENKNPQSAIRNPQSDHPSDVLGRISQYITGIYFEGDVVFEVDPGKEGANYKITATKLYYDFVRRKALVLDADFRMRVPETGLPIHLKAASIRQQTETRFAAEDVVISNDEFAEPHVGMRASRAMFNLPATAPGATRSQPFNYELNNVRTEVEGVPLTWWPTASGTGAEAQTPLRNLRTGFSSRLGATLETEWRAFSFFGKQEPNGVRANLLLDGYSERGAGGGLDVDYAEPTERQYFGHFLGYALYDDGEDRLGRYESLEDFEPEDETRGRVDWRHRHFLPLDWQASFMVDYQSDPTFLESWYRHEYEYEQPGETSIYLKQQRDNWAFDFLSKFHLNDFQYTQTELPAAGFHLAGQDIFETLTYHNDNYLSRVSERAGQWSAPGFEGIIPIPGAPPEADILLLPGAVFIPPSQVAFLGDREPWIIPELIDESDRSFGYSRHELGLPLQVGDIKLVPTGIGTFVFDDGPQDGVMAQGAGGLRASTQFAHVDNSAESRLFNIDRIRHVIQPQVSAFLVDNNEDALAEEEPLGGANSEINQSRHVLDLALLQRWQTLRGPEGKKTSQDLLRWDNDVMLVTNDADGIVTPNYFNFSTPETQYGPHPFLNPELANLGLARRQLNNLAFHDTYDSRLTWMATESVTLTGHINYDIHDEVMSQFDEAVAVRHTPRTSYWIGHLFLKDGDPFGDGEPPETDNANFLQFGGIYRLNAKYTFMAAHQFDLERSLSSFTEVGVIRKYAHWYGAFTAGYDDIRQSSTFMISFWPEGFTRFALGSRRYSHLTE